ncbi:MAG: ParB/RepB/Spo0J family partition protein [bacterium]
MKTKRLGKGLDALIPGDLSEEEKSNAAIEGIEIAKIKTNPYQPRTDFDRKRLRELTDSIKEKGVIQPITVRQKEDGFELIAGERRLRAVQELNFTKIPAYIMPDVTTGDEMLELSLIENVQRQDLNPIELAKAYQQLQKKYGLTQEEVAKKVGKDRATITNIVRLLKLPEKIQNSLKINEISIGHARALMSLPSESSQIKFLHKVVKNGWSVRKLEEEVKENSDKTKTHSSSKSSQEVLPEIYKEIEDQMRVTFGTKVRLRKKSAGGEITISFYSDDDLDRIIDLINLIPK